MDDSVASSNDEAGEDGEIQIVLEEIEVPTMEPTLQSPNKTHWLSEGTERFIKLAKGYGGRKCNVRSEEHTSELQSHVRISYAVFCLKKKKKKKTTYLYL